MAVKNKLNFTAMWRDVVDEVDKDPDQPSSDRFQKTEHTLVKKKAIRRRYYLQFDNHLVYLTSRERDVLFLLEKSSAKQIASQLMLSYRTVEFYIASLRAKFGCHRKKEIQDLIMRYDLLNQVSELE